MLILGRMLKAYNMNMLRKVPQKGSTLLDGIKKQHNSTDPKYSVTSAWRRSQMMEATKIYTTESSHLDNGGFTPTWDTGFSCHPRYHLVGEVKLLWHFPYWSVELCHLCHAHAIRPFGGGSEPVRISVAKDQLSCRWKTSAVYIHK